MYHVVSGRCLNFDQGSLIEFQVSETDKLKNINLRYIKVGFITKRKHGILLQISNGGVQTSDFRYISLEINNIGKHAYLNPLYSDGFSHTDITNKVGRDFPLHI